MKEDIKKIIENMDCTMPTTKEKIREVEKEIGVILPEEYKEFMLYTNGAEGEVGLSSYLTIWTIEEIVPLNEEYAVNEFTPGLIYFGSDGGEMAYGFDIRNDKKPIIEIPFESIHIEDEELISYSFYEFIKKLYNE